MPTWAAARTASRSGASTPPAAPWVSTSTRRDRAAPRARRPRRTSPRSASGRWTSGRSTGQWPRSRSGGRVVQRELALLGRAGPRAGPSGRRDRPDGGIPSAPRWARSVRGRCCRRCSRLGATGAARGARRLASSQPPRQVGGSSSGSRATARPASAGQHEGMRSWISPARRPPDVVMIVQVDSSRIVSGRAPSRQNSYSPAKAIEGPPAGSCMKYGSCRPRSAATRTSPAREQAAPVGVGRRNAGLSATLSTRALNIFALPVLRSLGAGPTDGTQRRRRHRRAPSAGVGRRRRPSRPWRRARPDGRRSSGPAWSARCSSPAAVVLTDRRRRRRTRAAGRRRHRPMT